MSRKKYWDLDALEFASKKAHLVNYLRSNSGKGIREVEREYALELASQLDENAFVEYVEKLDSGFSKQYKAAYRKSRTIRSLEDTKPVRLNKRSIIYIEDIIEMYLEKKPEDKDVDKLELTHKALHWIVVKQKCCECN
ncbi:hypothetical protein ACSTKO_23645 [Vibrio parahaemolyticus]